MRIHLKISPRESHPYDNDYHYHLQSLIYGLIREGGLPEVHERPGYKFFCFSNIYPYGDFKQGTERSILISSPNRSILDSIQCAALSKIESNDPLFVGNHQFDITYISKPFRINLQGNEIIVRSATPIVMRIPKTRLDEYGIKPKVDYGYVFWRETIPLEVFVKQLRDNIAKKWKRYYEMHVSRTKNRSDRDMESELIPEITYYKFIKTVSKPVTVKQVKQMIIGSLWEIGLSPVSRTEDQVLEFAVDCGFGERNSLGFGFMNALLR